MRWLLLIALVFGTGCASTDKSVRTLDYSKTFKVPYEMVWRATQQAMLNYPMNINNMDTGQLQTLYITGKHRYQAPHLKKKNLPSGFQYRLNISIIRGEGLARVIISKEARLQKDFFSEPEEKYSDGFEEKALLYRIRREIIIEKLIKKQMEKAQSKDKKGKTEKL